MTERAATGTRLGPPDAGVSPVVAEIMLVAIAVALAVGAWIFFSGIAGDAPASETVAFTAHPMDHGSNAPLSWIRVSLVHEGGDERPFSRLKVNVDAPNGASLTKADGILCIERDATSSGGNIVCASGKDVLGTSTTAWTVGTAYYIPCQASGAHTITATVDGTAVLVKEVTCKGSAPT